MFPALALVLACACACPCPAPVLCEPAGPATAALTLNFDMPACLLVLLQLQQHCSIENYLAGHVSVMLCKEGVLTCRSPLR
mmetsp:Transcript_81954/g.171506  ORF Transcript_81954/g.171506 Transcript_81954/m.171506 type:complete len:81 (+) Transcript_81954:136-378(+)